jgi:hypothetical protein
MGKGFSDIAEGNYGNSSFELHILKFQGVFIGFSLLLLEINYKLSIFMPVKYIQG